MYRFKTSIHYSKRTLWKAVAIALAVSVALPIAVAVLAAGAWQPKTVTGTGTVTVSQPSPPPPPPVTASVYDFSVSPETLDFSGGVASGNVYSATKQITITNTGTTGTDGGNATISGLVASVAAGLPDGWTLEGSFTGSLAPGASTPLDVTLTSPELTVTAVLSDFTITVEAN